MLRSLDHNLTSLSVNHDNVESALERTSIHLLTTDSIDTVHGQSAIGICGGNLYHAIGILIAHRNQVPVDIILETICAHPPCGIFVSAVEICRQVVVPKLTLVLYYIGVGISVMNQSHAGRTVRCTHKMSIGIHGTS